MAATDPACELIPAHPDNRRAFLLLSLDRLTTLPINPTDEIGVLPMRQIEQIPVQSLDVWHTVPLCNYGWNVSPLFEPVSPSTVKRLSPQLRPIGRGSATRCVVPQHRDRAADG